MSLFNLNIKPCRTWAFGALIMSTVVLSACGYRPLYGTSSVTPEVERHLASIQVKPIANRPGQMMRIALKQRLAPKSNGSKDVYQLTVTLNESLSTLAVEESAFATRANLSLSAHYTLIQLADNAQLLDGTAKTVASYNILSSDFATIAAKDDARERAILELADTLRTRMAIYFHGPAQAKRNTSAPKTYR